MGNRGFKGNCTDKESIYIGCDTSKPLQFKPFSKSNDNNFVWGTPGKRLFKNINEEKKREV